MMSIIFLFLIIVIATAKQGSNPEPIDVNQIHSPLAQCKFTVHEKNAEGPEVEGRR
jgi:hypothetical protein